MRSGTRLDYYWITCGPALNGARAQYGIHTLIQSCPEVFLDKYIAITSFDSGPLSLSSEEREAGWSDRNKIATSPRVTQAALSQLPFDTHDEWYVFERPSHFEVEETFVNYVAFTLTDASYIEGLRRHNRDEQDIDRQVRLTERFWQNLHRISPESYIADGDNFVFATRNPTLYAAVSAAIEAEPKSK